MINLFVTGDDNEDVNPGEGGRNIGGKLVCKLINHHPIEFVLTKLQVEKRKIIQGRPDLGK